MFDLNPTLHDPQKVAVDKKKKHYKTKYALKINDEEFKKAKSERGTQRLVKLAKEYGIPESREFSRHHLEDKVVVKEWGMIHPWKERNLVFYRKGPHTLEVVPYPDTTLNRVVSP
ncbi:hypothetical protein Tco_0700727 [Tanacetum coccineum]